MKHTCCLLVATLLLSALPAAQGQERANADLHGDPLPSGAIARLGTVRFRHAAPIQAVVFSPDGKLVISADLSGAIHLWEVPSGKERLRLKGSMYGKCLLGFSPDGKTLVFASGDQQLSLSLWDVASGKEVRKLSDKTDLPRSWWTVAFSAFSGKTVTSNAQASGVLWDMTTGKGPVGTGGIFSSLAFAPDGKTLAGCESGQDSVGKPTSQLRVWETATWKELRTQELGGGLSLEQVAFSPDGKILAVTQRSQIALSEVISGKTIRKLDGQLALPRIPFVVDGQVLALMDGQRGFRAIAFSPDGKLLASADDQAIRLWEPATGKVSRQLVNSISGASVAFSPDGTLLASADGHRVRLWEVATGREVTTPTGHGSAVTSVVWSPDGKSLTSAGDISARRWEAATGKPSHTFESRPTGRRPPFIHAFYEDFVFPSRYVTLFPDGKTLASGSLADRMVRLWDVASGKQLGELKEGFSGHTGSFAVSPDGKTLACATTALVPRVAYSSLSVWDVPTRQARPSPSLDLGNHSLAFSPDGKTLAIASYAVEIRGWGALKLYDATTGTERWHFDRPPQEQKPGQDRGLYSVAFSPDGETIATGDGERVIRLVSARTGKEVARLESRTGKLLSRLRSVVPLRTSLLGDAVTALAFSPDGKLLAAKDSERGIRMWDIASRKTVLKLEGTSGISCLAFPPDGKALASGMWDTTVLVWNLAGRGGKEPKED